ncbi:MAG TPA: HIT family protein [Polyangiaceae bacterium]|nr:HIT family protein [Polyangiaceae bacterium]
MSPLCPFCEIVAGRGHAHVVLDEPRVVAFLDVRPVFPGHVLVVPRAHRRALSEVPPEQVGDLFAAAQRVAAAIEASLGAEGAFVALNDKVSQSVPHVHVHVVPRRRKDGLRGFFWPRHAYATEQEAAAIACRIRAGFA